MKRPHRNATRLIAASALLFAGIITAEQNVTVAPGDEKAVGITTENPGQEHIINVTRDSDDYKFRTGGSDNILGEHRDASLWQRTENTEDKKTFKVIAANIHDSNDAVFKMEFEKPEGGGGGGGGGTPPPELENAYVKAVNCFVKIHTPGTIAAPGALIPAPTVAGKAYTGILQANIDDEVTTGFEDHTTGSKTGDGLTKDNDLVKVELSWNPTTLKQHMVDNKDLQLVLPPNTKAYLASGAALTDMTVTIGGGASGQLADLGGSARKQNIFIEGNAGSATAGGTREIKLYVNQLDHGDAGAKAKLVPADLAIHNGQAAPAPIVEKDEELPGAFTVANLNDTDGDGIIDNDISETSVKRITKGTDEEDLMKLIVTGPSTGRLKLTVVSGQVAFWEKSTKEIQIDTPGNPVFFMDCADLPKTLWVEATNFSSALRDIEMELGYETPGAQLIDGVDTVNATAVWGEKTSVKKTNGDALWTNAKDPLKDIFNNFLGGDFGPNFTTAQSAAFHFTIGFEFTVMPSGIGQEPGVAFDITRDIAHRDWTINGVNVQQLPGNDVFDAGDISDDDHITEDDEDVLSPSNKIYSLDGPGHPLVAINDQIVSRNNFEEFVRVSFDGVRPSGENDNGSRCSENIPWHAFYWVDKDPTSGNHRMRAGKQNVVDEGHLPFGNTPTP